MELLFYDIEVFKHNSLVVFKDSEGKTVRVFSSSLHGLGDYYTSGLITNPGYKGLKEFIKGKTLVGFNNYHYDDYILYAMSMCFSQDIIKEWNDSIIQGTSLVNMKKITSCTTLDAWQQIDISMPSLKKIEGNMGKSIIESTVSFDIDRELTPAENLEVLKYCEYDVLQTIEVYNMRKNYFTTKQVVIDMIGDETVQKKAIKWNTTTIVGHILKPNRTDVHEIDQALIETMNDDVQEMWQELFKYCPDYDFKVKKTVVNEFKNQIEFGWGGLHGAPEGFIKRDNVKLVDVTSMYPNILILLNALGDKTGYYKEILNKRVEIKHTNQELSNAYKLILNSTYGLLNNQYSKLNNPKVAFSTCIYGQIALYHLARGLASIGAEIININTDGVAYVYDGNLDVQVQKDWEREFKLALETEYYDKWIQKDVNNYIAVTKGTSKLKLKGGDVNKYASDKYFANNDVRINHIALVDYILHGVRVEDTLLKHRDSPGLFQYILKAGKTYQGVVNSNNPEVLLRTQVNRIFATRIGDSEIVKKRLDGGLVKFADAPSRMFVWNDDVKNLKDFGKIVDKQWYYDLIRKNLERWR